MITVVYSAVKRACEGVKLSGQFEFMTLHLLGLHTWCWRRDRFRIVNECLALWTKLWRIHQAVCNVISAIQTGKLGVQMSINAQQSMWLCASFLSTLFSFITLHLFEYFLFLKCTYRSRWFEPLINIHPVIKWPRKRPLIVVSIVEHKATPIN